MLLAPFTFHALLLLLLLCIVLCCFSESFKVIMIQSKSRVYGNTRIWPYVSRPPSPDNWGAKHSLLAFAVCPRQVTRLAPLTFWSSPLTH